ncbi:hypothetical protein SPRG_13734 [Saprolegnia parasitica CBS 223.65]|uniref:P-type domain-containing protein n=1 Tax=Saprolegnia parasitica (strain CBS 223.65) TaxID=695850 RepID=A0A067BWN2_SAPPC|nr:hypothetical protein SPRG_13734 [Saprolegnia parasitica CBS 223.65]KDO21235.1 hypothetical protein SPRG_13734 [Saprolegnia parasitica CBS 223.65]|eukprot:XP_012208067.1 hypothetical protein SPRG_13734 [Saprolegnia parasitica CBS 223.65]
MEWSLTNRFRDRATMVVTNRRLAVPSFRVDDDDDGWLTITTSHIALHYDPRSVTSFGDGNLRVTALAVGHKNATWIPSATDNDTSRLTGTIRTLDMTNGSVNLDCHAGGPDYIADSHCTYGVGSKRGYVVLDDSLSYELSNATYPWLVPKVSVPSPGHACAIIPPDERRICGANIASEDECVAAGCCFDNANPLPHGFVCYYSPQSYQDLYFFGHGRRFKDALREFTAIAGHVPLPPRYAFGVFYSRWWAYSDVEVEGLAADYASRRIPLDTIVLDMDWHLTFYKNHTLDQAQQPKGWTGLTWNKELFPSPKSFLQHLHAKGLRVTLNLHPASGVQPWEDSYVAVATAMGIDPSSQRYVPFDLTNQTFATAWLTLSLRPHELDGISFWWLDWQQGEDWFVAHDQARASLSPTLWLNHVFFTNPYHWPQSQTRPLLLHRFGGLGSHRYPVGFSGDVEASWASLAFQPAFTASAANVGFGYWSHDLGGFLHGSDPELYTRWIQWGAFSPIFRTHSKKDVHADRRIWKFPDPFYAIMHEFMTLRRQLVSYIYTAARETFASGVGLLHALYLEWPDLEAAYNHTDQYLFGSAYLIAPVVSPLNASTQTATRHVWVPPGLWFDETFGALLRGPSKYTAQFTLNDMPRFLRAGSIVPLDGSVAGSSLGAAQRLPQVMRLVVVPGYPVGSGSVYEDGGDSDAYLTTNEYAFTAFNYRMDTPTLGVIAIEPVAGSFPTMHKQRSYEVVVRHVSPPTSVAVNGELLGADGAVVDHWRYDASTLSLHVQLQTPLDVTHRVLVHLVFSNASHVALNNVAGLFARLKRVKSLLDDANVLHDDVPAVVHAAQTPRRIDFNVSSFEEELQQLPSLVQASRDQVQALSIASVLKAQVHALLQVPTVTRDDTTTVA